MSRTAAEMAVKMAKVRSERVSVALLPEIAQGARDASGELGMSMSSWLAMAIGRAVRAHRLESEVLERVLRETFGEQMKLQLAEMEQLVGSDTGKTA